MTVGVSHSFSGTVVVVDLADGKRFDLSPEQADSAAADLDSLVANGCPVAFTVIQALDDRAFRFGGKRADFQKMAADLRLHAGNARTMAVGANNDNGGTAA